VVGMASNLAVLISVMLHPFMPAVSKQIREQTNIEKLHLLPEHPIQFLEPGHKIGKPIPLFTKLEPKQITEWKLRFGAADTSTGAKVEKSEVKKNKKENPSSPKKMAHAAKSSYPELAGNQKKIHNIFSTVQAQFEQAKAKFEAEQIDRLDKENEKLRAEVENLKKILVQKEKKAGITQIEVNLPSKISEPVKPSLNGNVVNAKEVENGSAKASDAKAAKKSEPKPAKNETKGAPADDLIDIGRIDLRVGRIIEAKKHPDADALYVESIDVGEDKPRTVVSGLVKYVPLEEMQNRLVVVMCNLKPVKMRGIESQAMVMCASSPDAVEIMEVDPSAVPGTPVYCTKFPHRPDAVLNPKKKIWETVAPDLKVSPDGLAVYKDELLLVGGKTHMKAKTLRNVNIK